MKADKALSMRWRVTKRRWVDVARKYRGRRHTGCSFAVWVVGAHAVISYLTSCAVLWEPMISVPGFCEALRPAYVIAQF